MLRKGIGLLTLAIRKRGVGVTFSPVCLSSDTKALRVHETPFAADSNRKTRHIVFFHERVPAITTRSRLRIPSLADREAAHVVGKTLAIPVAKLRFKSQRRVISLIVSCSIAE